MHFFRDMFWSCYNLRFIYFTHSVWKSLQKSYFYIASEASYVYILSGHK